MRYQVIYLFIILFFSAALTAEKNTTIAVLPFNNHADEALEWLRHGLSDSLISKFENEKSISLIERDRVVKVINNSNKASEVELLALLQADYLCIGSYSADAANIRIHVRLVHSESAKVIKDSAIVVSGKRKDIFALESKLAEEIALRLKLIIPSVNLKRNVAYNFDSYRLFNLAKLSFHNKKYEKAKNLFRSAQEHNQGVYFSKAHAWEGLSWRMLKQSAKDHLQKQQLSKNYIDQFRKDAAEAAPAFYNLALAYHSTKDYEQAVKAVDAYLKWILESYKLRGWSKKFTHFIPLKGSWTEEALTIMFSYSKSSKDRDFITDRISAEPAIGNSEGHSNMIVSMNVKSGEIKWGRKCKYPFAFSSSHLDNDVYVWGRGFVERLNGHSGNTLWKKTVDSKSLSVSIRMIKNSGNHFIPRTDQPHRENLNKSRFGHIKLTDKKTVFNIHTGESERLSSSKCATWLYSTDGAKSLSYEVGNLNNKSTMFLSSKSTRSGNFEWQFPLQSTRVSRSSPFWKEGCAFMLYGGEKGNADVFCIDGNSGKLKWQYTLPQGRYMPGQQLPGGAYADGSFNVYGMIGDYMAVIDSQRTIHFLNPKNGKLQFRHTCRNNLLTFPAIVNDKLVVVLFDSVYSVPLMQLKKPLDISEKRALLLKARCLAGMGDWHAAKDLMTHLIKLDNNNKNAWDFMADIYQHNNDERNECLARLRSMSLSNRQKDDVLYKKWGLIHRYPIESKISNMLKMGDVIVAGSINGDVYHLKSHAPKIELKQQHKKQLNRLLHSSLGKVSGKFANEKQLTELYQAKKTDGIDCAIEVSVIENRSFKSTIGYDGPTVRMGDKLLRPCHKGDVKIVDNKKLIFNKTKIKGIKEWRLYDDHSMKIGFGDNGVYELNDQWVPEEYIFQYPIRWGNRGAHTVQQLRVLGDKMGVVTFRDFRSKDRLFLIEVRDRMDGRLLGEVPLNYHTFRTSLKNERLKIVGKGFLFIGQEIVYVDANKITKAWSFSPPLEKEYVIDRFQTHFYSPIITKKYLIVAGQDYALYYFDLDFIKSKTSID